MGAQAGGQSEHCLQPWEDREAGAESQPYPLQPRVTPSQDYLPHCASPPGGSFPQRTGLLPCHPGVISDSFLILPTFIQQFSIDSLPEVFLEFLSSSSSSLPALVRDLSSYSWTAHCCLLLVAPIFYVAARRLFLTHKPELVTVLLKTSPCYPTPCSLCSRQAAAPLYPFWPPPNHSCWPLPASASQILLGSALASPPPGSFPCPSHSLL